MNDNSKLDHRELNDNELDAASGGDRAADYSYLKAMEAWHNLLGQYRYPYQP